MGLIEKTPNILAPLIQSILPGLEEEGNEFFDQILDLLLLLKSTAGDVRFNEAIWDTILDAPCQRLASFHLVHYQGIGRLPNSSLVPLEPQRKAIIAIGESMLDSSPLVVRFALEYLFRNISLDDNDNALRLVILNFNSSSISLNEKLYLVKQMLMVLLHKDISLSRRVYSWLSPLNTSIIPPHNVLVSVPTSSPIKLVLKVLDRMVIELFESTINTSTSIKSAHRLFRILISLLDKEELCETICNHLLLPIISGLAKAPFLIEESLMFFEILDVNIIWGIFQSSISIDKIASMKRIEFALNSIKWVCDDECANIILPPFFLSITTMLAEVIDSFSKYDNEAGEINSIPSNKMDKELVISDEKVTFLSTTLSLLESISNKIPPRCLGEKGFNNLSSKTDISFAQGIIQLLLPIQQGLYVTKQELLEIDDPELFVLPQRFSPFQDQIEALQKLIEWASLGCLGLLKGHPSTITSCSCGCDEAISGPDDPLSSPIKKFFFLPLDLILVEELAIHSIYYSLDIKRFEYPPSITVIFSALRILISFWKYIKCEKSNYIKSMAYSQIPFYWISSLETYNKNSTFWEATYAALWALSHLCSIGRKIASSLSMLSQDSLDERYIYPSSSYYTYTNPYSLEGNYPFLQLPSLQGHPISALDLFLSRYLNDPDSYNKEERTKQIVRFWLYQPQLSSLSNIKNTQLNTISLLLEPMSHSHTALLCLGTPLLLVKIPLFEYALTWTILSLLEGEFSGWLLSEILSSSISFPSKERLFEPIISYLEHVLSRSNEAINHSIFSGIYANVDIRTFTNMAIRTGYDSSATRNLQEPTFTCNNMRFFDTGGSSFHIGFSIPITLSLLERLESLLNSSLVNGLAFLQILNGSNICSAIGLSCPSNNNQVDEKCCAKRTLLRLISVLTQISTAFLPTSFNLPTNNSNISDGLLESTCLPNNNMLDEFSFSLKKNLSLLRMTALRIGLHLTSQAIHLNGFLKCPSVKSIFSSWVGRLASSIFIPVYPSTIKYSTVLANESIQHSTICTEEEILAYLSAILFICSTFSDKTTTTFPFFSSLMTDPNIITTIGTKNLHHEEIFSFAAHISDLLLTWTNGASNNPLLTEISKNITEIDFELDKRSGHNYFSVCNALLDFCFAFWGGSLACRWSFFLPLLYKLSGLDNKENEVGMLLFWRIVDFLTGGYTFLSGIKYLMPPPPPLPVPSQILLPLTQTSLLTSPAPQLDLDEHHPYKNIENDLLLLSIINRSILSSKSTAKFFDLILISLQPFSKELSGGSNRTLSSIALPIPLWVLCFSLSTEKDPQLLSALITHILSQTSCVFPGRNFTSDCNVPTSNTSNGTMMTKAAAILELATGFVELFRDIFLLSHKNSMLYTILGGGAKNSSNFLLPQITEASILGAIEAILRAVAIKSQVTKNGVSISSDLVEFFTSVWGTNTSGLFSISRDILGTLSKRRPSFLACTIGLLKILAVIIRAMAPVGHSISGSSKIVKEAGDLFSRVFEHSIAYISKNNTVSGGIGISASLESVLLSRDIIENILLDSDIVNASDLDSDSLITQLMNVCVMPCIKSTLVSLQKTPLQQWATIACAGGRCARYPGCRGVGVKECVSELKVTSGTGGVSIFSTITTESTTGDQMSFGSNASITPPTLLQACTGTTCVEGGSPASELHMYLAVALMLMQKMFTTISWRKELLETLFLDTNLRFFALPLWHISINGYGRCWCLRRALVTMITSPLTSMGGYNGDGGTAADIFYNGARKSSAASSFFSVLSGGRIGGASSMIIESEIAMHNNSNVSSSTNTVGSIFSENISLSGAIPTTITTVRRLAYALLSQGQLMALSLPQIHEKVSELFRLLRSMEYYQGSSSTNINDSKDIINTPPSGSAYAASMLLGSLLLLFRVLVIRFGISSVNGGGNTNSMMAASTIAPTSNNNSPILLSWWPTLNAELLLYTGKILSNLTSITSKLAIPEKSSTMTLTQTIKNNVISQQNRAQPYHHRLFRKQSRSTKELASEVETAKSIIANHGDESPISATSVSNGDSANNGNILLDVPASPSMSAPSNIKATTPMATTANNVKTNITSNIGGRYGSLVTSDLISICKLIELLLKGGVEEIHMHSWWLFGPSGLLSQLYPLLDLDSTTTRSRQIREDVDINDDISISYSKDYNYLSENTIANNMGDNSPNNNQQPSDGRIYSEVDEKTFSSFFPFHKEVKCSRLVSFLRIASQWPDERSCPLRTLSYQHSFIEYVEHEMLEEEFYVLEGGLLTNIKY